MRKLRRMIASVVLVAFVGALLPAAPAEARNVTRTMAGAAGVGAGAMAGFALGSAIVGAGAVATLPPVALFLIQGTVIAGCAWAGGKLMSRLGLELDETLGPQMTWTLIGASLGTLAAITLFPPLGPAFGVLGPVIKGLIGGVAGGILGRMLAPELESIATPRVMYGAAGGVVGGLAGGPVGALAGVAGGYALGDIMDRGFFADEDKELQNSYRYAQWKNRRSEDRYREWHQDLFDWVNDRRQAFRERVNDDWDYYDNYEDSFYCQLECDDKEDEDVYHSMKLRKSQRMDREAEAELIELQRQWKEALRAFEKLNDDEAGRRERGKALERVRDAQARYERALREASSR